MAPKFLTIIGCLLLSLDDLVFLMDVPKLHIFGFPEGVELGGSVQILCNLKKGDLPVKFSWTKDGKPISDKEGIETGIFNDRSSFLVIQSVSYLNMGNYTCVVRNDKGSDSHTAQLLIPGMSVIKIGHYPLFVSDK
ncbi:cell adhesion molecule Dscam2-like isoform X2 [Tachypleus tridentatus]|uniref:cell adhesion molecule Dscam2-like isoform X2 n=1 Tax=Tachypleus tridentatus TaxID=6853 RepID=UPI003FD069D3